MVTKSILRVLLITMVVLLVPFIGMQFSDEMQWDLGDFLIIGALTLGITAAYELAAARMKSPTNKILVALGFAALFVLIWAQLAVGII